MEDEATAFLIQVLWCHLLGALTLIWKSITAWSYQQHFLEDPAEVLHCVTVQAHHCSQQWCEMQQWEEHPDLPVDLCSQSHVTSQLQGSANKKLHSQKRLF